MNVRLSKKNIAIIIFILAIIITILVLIEKFLYYLCTKFLSETFGILVYTFPNSN